MCYWIKNLPAAGKSKEYKNWDLVYREVSVALRLEPCSTYKLINLNKKENYSAYRSLFTFKKK